MLTAKLTRWGNSLGLRIPKQFVDAHNFQDGEVVSLRETADGFSAAKVRKVKRYDLDEILAGVENLPREEFFDWGEPVGREVW